jgi:fumarate reductase flavoprotein subunit
MPEENDYDVVVVGSGAAGLSAALAADDAGASVLVAESEDIVGGSSRLSGGQIMGAVTRLQAKCGIEDSVEDFYRYYMTLNQWRLEPAVIRRFCEEAGSAIDWLVDQGVVYQENLYYAADEPTPRDHAPDLAGAGVMEVLYARCKERRGIDFALRRRVDRMIVEDGRVRGVAVGDDEVRAGAVVVSTGGFGNNPELVREYFPYTELAGDWLWYLGADGSRGDALSFAKQIDAQVVRNVEGQLLLTPNFHRVPEVYFPGWLVMVNGKGHRFFDETSNYSITEPIVRDQPRPIFAIFDDAAKRAATYGNAGAAKKQDLPGPTGKKWVNDVIDENLANGRVLQADTFEELAQKAGLPVSQFLGTMSRYNSDAERGLDAVYLKNPKLMQPIVTPPFYATELRMAILAHTDVGLRIDPEARVVGESSWPIPGLYAAGECTGNVIGNIYVGSGNSYANCVVFGRIAGRNAAAEAKAMAVGA